MTAAGERRVEKRGSRTAQRFVVAGRSSESVGALALRLLLTSPWAALRSSLGPGPSARLGTRRFW